MTDFADLADGGRVLASCVPAEDSTLVLAVVPNGVPAGCAVAQALDAPLAGVRVERSDHEISRVVLPELGDLPDATRIVVVDDAVESGSAALAIGAALRSTSAVRVVLAVPVCPLGALDALAEVFDEVVAPVRPSERHPLTHHYATFEPVPIDVATAMMARYSESWTVRREH